MTIFFPGFQIFSAKHLAKQRIDKDDQSSEVALNETQTTPAQKSIKAKTPIVTRVGTNYVMNNRGFMQASGVMPLSQARDSYEVQYASDRPITQAKLEEILNNVIEGYCNQDLNAVAPEKLDEVKKFIEVLRDDPPIQIKLSNSLETNACADLASRIITLNLGIIRTIIKRGDSGELKLSKANEHQIASVVSHELTHFVEPYSRWLGHKDEAKDQHEKEDFCDVMGMTFMDFGGYNVYYAGVDCFSKDADSINSSRRRAGTSHHDSYSRQLKVNEKKETGYWNNYAEEESKLLSQELVEEANRVTRFEILLDPANRALPENKNSKIVTILNILDNYIESKDSYYQGCRGGYPANVTGSNEERQESCDKIKAILDESEFSEASKRIIYTLIQNRYIIGDREEKDDILAKPQDVLTLLEEMPSMLEFEFLNKEDAEKYYEKFQDFQWVILYRGLTHHLKFETKEDFDILSKIIELLDYNFEDGSFGYAYRRQYCKKEFWDLKIKNAELAIPVLHELIDNKEHGYLELLIDNCFPYYGGKGIILEDQKVKDYLISSDLISSDKFERKEKLKVLSMEEIFNKIINSSNDNDLEEWVDVFCRTVRKSIKKNINAEENVKVFLKNLGKLKEIGNEYCESKLESYPFKSDKILAEIAETYLAILNHQKKEKLSLDDYKAVFAIHPTYLHDRISNTDIVNDFVNNLNLNETREALKACGSLTLQAVTSSVGDDHYGELKKAIPGRLVSRLMELQDLPNNHVLAKNYSEEINIDYQTNAYVEEEYSDEFPLEFDQEIFSKLSEADIKLIIAHGSEPDKVYFMTAYLDTLIGEKRFNEDALFELSQIAANDFSIRVKGREEPYPKYSESMSFIRFNDFLYMKYFQVHGFDFFEKMNFDETKAWFEKYYPKPSKYRDIIVRKVFAKFFAQDELENPFRARLAKVKSNGASQAQLEKVHNEIKEAQFQVIAMLHKEENTYEWRAALYDMYKDVPQGLSAQIGFLVNEAFPKASPERDLLIEDILLQNQFTKSDYQKIVQYYSHNSRKTENINKIIDGSIGAMLTKASENTKSDILLWMMRKGEKPESIVETEKYNKVNYDEFQDVLHVKTFRDKILNTIFPGNNGLFSENEHGERALKRFLDGAFGEYFKAEPGNSDTINKSNKLKEFAQLALHSIFRSKNNLKKSRIMKRLFDRMYQKDAKEMTLADIVVTILSAYGPVGVKLGQILGSLEVIQREYPELYIALAELKDENDPMSIYDSMLVINRNPRLKDCDYTIEKRVKAASMKSVLRARVKSPSEQDESKVAVKLRRANSDKNLNEEEEDLRRIINDLSPALDRLFGIQYVPDYTSRIFRIIREEGFENEISNIEKMTSLLANVKLAKGVNLRIPKLYSNVSDQNTIVEEYVDAPDLDIWLSSANKRNQKFTKVMLQRLFLHKIFKEKFYHADPHSKNIKADISNEGLDLILLDLGLTGSLDAKLEANLTKLARAITVHKKLRSRSKLKEIYGDIVRGFLPEGFEVNNEVNKYINEATESMLKADSEKLVAVLLEKLDSIPGYEVPYDLFKLLTALSKTPYLFDVYLKNWREYSNFVFSNN